MTHDNAKQKEQVALMLAEGQIEDAIRSALDAGASKIILVWLLEAMADELEQEEDQ